MQTQSEVRACAYIGIDMKNIAPGVSLGRARREGLLGQIDFSGLLLMIRGWIHLVSKYYPGDELLMIRQSCESFP